jgi:ribonuclease P protein component
MITCSFLRAAPSRPGDRRRKQLEKNVSAKQCLQEEDARVQGPHEHQEWTVGPQEKTGQRKKTLDGLTARADLRFPRIVRVRSRGDYLRIQNRGKKIRGRYLILLAIHNNLPVSRFGITVSKRIGNAVRRNSIKRKIREIQRLNRDNIDPGHDVVVIARQRASEATFRQLEAEYLRLARNGGLMQGADKT